MCIDNIGVKIRIYNLILLLTVSGLSRFCVGQNRSYSELLYDTLLTNYNRHVRPAENQSQATAVSVKLSLLSLKELEEVSGKFSVVGYFNVYWKDERLVWSPARYGNTDRLYIPQSQVWKPELILINPYKKMQKLGFDDLLVRYNSGTAEWMVGDVMDTICDIDVTYFPFDEQKCTLVFSVWGYTSRQVSINVTSESIDFSLYSENVEWIITKTKGYEVTTRQHATLVYEIHLERRYVYFVVNVFVPVILLTLLGTMVFQLPADSGERVGYSVTCLLAVAVFLTIVSDTLPKASNPVSVLTIFLMLDFIVSTAMCVLTILGLCLHHKDNSTPVPKWITVIVDFVKCKECRKPKHNHVVLKVKESQHSDFDKQDLQSSKDTSHYHVNIVHDVDEIANMAPSPSPKVKRDHLSRDRKVYPTPVETGDVNMKIEEHHTWKSVAKTYDTVCFVLCNTVILILMVVYVMFANLV